MENLKSATQNIYSKLAIIQKDLNAPKNQKNSFGGYNYRSCEDILEAVKPLLAANNVTLVLSDDVILLGERFYVKATAKIIDIGTGDTIENTALAREEETKKGMDASQITGASSSYARKYALNGLFCIDDNKDSDKTNVGEPEPETEKKPKNIKIPKGFQADTGEVTEEQIKEIKELVPNVAGMLSYVELPNLESLGKEQAQAIIESKRGK